MAKGAAPDVALAAYNAALSRSATGGSSTLGYTVQMTSAEAILGDLAKSLLLGALLDDIRARWGTYELLHDWKQGEFHHDVVVRAPAAAGALGGDIFVIGTNCNGGVKEVSCFESLPDRSALWHARCPDNPEFSGAAPAMIATARTEHWFDPRELLVPEARSEYREEFRERQCGGGWMPRKSKPPE